MSSHDSKAVAPSPSTARPAAPRTGIGVRIAGTGSAIPSRVLSNHDLETLVSTNDEWIVQRTGIRERRVCDWKKGESNLTLCTDALRIALERASTPASELDLIICGTITQDLRCPSTACLVAAKLGAGTAAAWDLGAACSGFVYSLNVAHDLIRVGTHKAVGVIGCDTISAIVDYTNRGVCILFGDAAGAAVLKATDDANLGCIAQVNKADGHGWKELFMPGWAGHLPPGPVDSSAYTLGCLHMNGREVFKFAVSTFQELIAETLTKSGLAAGDVDMFVCHQSNARILEAAREKFGIPERKLYVNIDRVGNTSAGSVPLCLDELVRAGRVHAGQKVMLVAFGAGLTWGASLWQL